MQKRAIIYLFILLAFCTILAGCVSSFSPEGVQDLGAGAPESETYVAETSSFDETSELDNESAVTVTMASTSTVTTEADTRAKAPASATPATKPPATGTTAAKPTTTVKLTTSPPSTISPNPSDLVLDDLIGNSSALITQRFGEPVAVEKSEYGFNWHVYHHNYTKFVMIGIDNNKVVALYSNSQDLKIENIAAGTARSTVRKILCAKYGGDSGPLTFIDKGTTRHSFSEQVLREWDVFWDGQNYVTIFYDNIVGGKLCAVQIIDYATEQSCTSFHAPSTGFTDSYEMLSFYLINASRANFNKSPLQYDKNMAHIAAGHSQDMIDRSFFNHVTPNGQDFRYRINAAGYQFAICAENIAKNCPGAIIAHEAYMNSQNHRNNILGSTERIGIGVRMGEGDILQTELFITYK